VCVQDLNLVIQKKLFEDLEQFVQNARKCCFSSGRRKEIPTAALLTGMFEKLCSVLNIENLSKSVVFNIFIMHLVICQMIKILTL